MALINRVVNYIPEVQKWHVNLVHEISVKQPNQVIYRHWLRYFRIAIANTADTSLNANSPFTALLYQSKQVSPRESGRAQEGATVIGADSCGIADTRMRGEDLSWIRVSSHFRVFVVAFALFLLNPTFITIETLLSLLIVLSRVQCLLPPLLVWPRRLRFVA